MPATEPDPPKAPMRNGLRPGRMHKLTLPTGATKEQIAEFQARLAELARQARRDRQS